VRQSVGNARMPEKSMAFTHTFHRVLLVEQR